MSNRRSVATAVLAATIGFVACLPMPGGASEPAADPIDAIWLIHSVDLEYRSFNTYYSCAAFKAKIGSILRAVGAHESVLVDVRCPGRGFLRYARAQLRLRVPASATPDNVRAATTYDSRTELAARLHSISLPRANDLPRFHAAWRTISLTRDSSLRLDSGDCDLLEAVRDQVFPKLAIKVTKDQLHCTSWSPIRLPPTLEVAALVPIAIAYAQ